MLLLNISHPLTANHLAQLEALTGQAVERVVEVPAHFDVSRAFAGQVTALVDGLGLSATEWQTLPVLVNPPSLNTITAVLLAELHGRMGYWPPVLRMRRGDGTTPSRFEVAEVINLQEVRDVARARREE